MKRLSRFTLPIGLVLGGLLLAILLFARPAALPETASPSEPSATATEPAVVHQSESEARAADIALAAEAEGLPVEEVERAITFQEAFDEYTRVIRSRYPDQISGTWVDPLPATKGYIRFTGEVPAAARTELDAHDLLDPGSVILLAGGEISQEDQRHRAALAADALADLGYTNFTTGLDVEEQIIHIQLKISEATPQPDRNEIAAALQARLQAERTEDGEPRFHGRAATVIPDDLELTVERAAVPPAEPAPAEGSPLATWDASLVMAAPEASSGTGTLEITDDCTRLVHDNGSTTLLLWPWPTAWNATSQTIEFVGVSDERAELQDGDRISAGGRAGPHTLAQADPPDTGEPPMPAPTLVTPPDPACRADGSFIVSSVRVESSD